MALCHFVDNCRSAPACILKRRGWQREGHSGLCQASLAERLAWVGAQKEPGLVFSGVPIPQSLQPPASVLKHDVFCFVNKPKKKKKNQGNENLFGTLGDAAFLLFPAKPALKTFSIHPQDEKTKSFSSQRPMRSQEEGAVCLHSQHFGLRFVCLLTYLHFSLV